MTILCIPWILDLHTASDDRPHIDSYGPKRHRETRRYTLITRFQRGGRQIGMMRVGDQLERQSIGMRGGSVGRDKILMGYPLVYDLHFTDRYGLGQWGM